MLDNKIIGKRLKAARSAKDMTQGEFAAPACIDVSQYSRIERGVEGISLPKTVALSESHGINVLYLITGKGEILHNDQPGAPLNLDDIARMLQAIFDEQVLTRADVLAFGEYQVMKDAQNNREAREKIMEQINMLVGVNVSELKKRGNSPGRDN